MGIGSFVGCKTGKWAVEGIDGRVYAYSGNESGLDFGLTQSKIEDIINTPKGNRPDPSSYLSQEYIDAHLAQFDDGVSVVQTEWAYSRYSETNGFVGVPDDNSLFVMPKNYCDDVIARANGNISIIEKELGFPEGYFSDGGLIRIDAPNTADGNETANKRIAIQNIFLDILPKTWSFLADRFFLIFLSFGKF